MKNIFKRLLIFVTFLMCLIWTLFFGWWLSILFEIGCLCYWIITGKEKDMFSETGFNIMSALFIIDILKKKINYINEDEY